jgi:hypothetical protein
MEWNLAIRKMTDMENAKPNVEHPNALYAHDVYVLQAMNDHEPSNIFFFYDLDVLESFVKQNEFDEFEVWLVRHGSVRPMDINYDRVLVGIEESMDLNRLDDTLVSYIDLNNLEGDE